LHGDKRHLPAVGSGKRARAQVNPAPRAAVDAQAEAERLYLFRSDAPKSIGNLVRREYAAIRLAGGGDPPPEKVAVKMARQHAEQSAGGVVGQLRATLTVHQHHAYRKVIDERAQIGRRTSSRRGLNRSLRWRQETPLGVQLEHLCMSRAVHR